MLERPDLDLVERIVETTLSTKHGPFRLLGYRDAMKTEHVALVWDGRDPTGRAAGNGATASDIPLVRVHSECLTGDALGSYRCDCGEQLDSALHAIAEAGSGALVYVRGHEGRGIGLMAKLEAYSLQDQGLDTVDANTSLGLPVDARRYQQAAEILKDLGLTTIRLLSANPAKQAALEDRGIDVRQRFGVTVPERPENARYLATKRTRMRHDPPGQADVWRRLIDGDVPSSTPGGPQDDLVGRYGYLVASDTPLVVAQLGQSMDGFIASRTGDAEFVTGPEDREHLHRLRALVDAVVVGAGTVAADDCKLTVRTVPGVNPVRVILDPTARVPRSCQLLTDDAASTLWVVGPDAEVPTDLAAHLTLRRLSSLDHFAPDRLLRMLRLEGLDKVLVEGGGYTVSRFLEAGALDRLYLTVAPLLVGDGVPGIRFTGADALSKARSAPARRFIFGQDVCTEFDFSQRP